MALFRSILAAITVVFS